VTAKEDDLLSHQLGSIVTLAIWTFPAAGLKPTLDIDLGALLESLLT
jgi:hypothetical protein